MKDIIVGLGEILWDVFPERKVLGGAPANFAYHVSQFGFKGYALSAIGEDALGKEILDSLADKKLNHLIETTNFQTGTVKVELNKSGVPTYKICEHVAWDNIPFTEKTKALAKNTKAVCFGSLAQRSQVSRDTIRMFISNMPKDSLKIFDINIRLNFYTKEVIEESLRLANIMKINEDEIRIIADMMGWDESDEEIGKKLLSKYDLDILILTKGTEGSFVITVDKVSYQSTPKVHVADTVGAGDSFTATFVAALLNNWSIEDAHKLAVEVSAYVCLYHGAMPKLADSYLEIFNK